jgi:hypothetical protein
MGWPMTHARRRALDAVRVVNDTVQDGVRERGITDQVMPSFDRNVAGDQCGITTVTLFDDLQSVIAEDNGVCGSRPTGESCSNARARTQRMSIWSTTTGAVRESANEDA